MEVTMARTDTFASASGGEADEGFVDPGPPFRASACCPAWEPAAASVQRLAVSQQPSSHAESATAAGTPRGRTDPRPDQVLDRRVLAVEADERRRIALDLHDGTQQRLVVLLVGLSELPALIDDDPTRATTLARRLEHEAQEAIAELRALVHGMQPPELTDFGLMQALTELGRSSPIPVSTTTQGVRRYDRTIEDAVYFTCREAVQNTIKHAPDATIITLTLIDTGRRLEFLVADDGPGMAHEAPDGTGLASMRHRIAALGGTLTIDAAPGAGTRVRASLPVHE
jgi:signal transduction histidine kinase